MKSEVPSSRFIQAVKSVPSDEKNFGGTASMFDFDVKAEILRTYEMDRKQYYLEDSAKGRKGDEAGT